MNTEDRATPTPLFPVVSNDELDYYSISSPHLLQERQFSNNELTASPILPELPPQQSSQEDTYGAQFEEATYGATTGRTIWERYK